MSKRQDYLFYELHKRFLFTHPDLGARASRPPRSGRRPLQWPAATMRAGRPRSQGGFATPKNAQSPVSRHGREVPPRIVVVVVLLVLEEKPSTTTRTRTRTKNHYRPSWRRKRGIGATTTANSATAIVERVLSFYFYWSIVAATRSGDGATTIHLAFDSD